MSSLDSIGESILLLYDELKDDPEAQKNIDLMDKGVEDRQIKQGIIGCVDRLITLGKNDLAQRVKDKTKGFAY